MKKILFLMTVMGAMVSCTNNEIDEVNPVLQDESIGFSTLRDKPVSRDANDTKSNFQVYANIVGGEYWYIDDVFASQSTSQEVGESTTDKIYYWPGTEKLNFYAFAPDKTALGTSVVTATAGATPSVSIQYVAPATGNQDFTIATPVVQDGVTNRNVALNFKHMLSKIVFTVQLSAAMQKNGYSMNTDYTTTLNVSSTGATINAASATPAWSSPNTTAASYTGANTYMFMPQASSGCSIDVKNVTITLNATTAPSVVFYGDLKNFAFATGNIPGDAFGMGKIYNATITITAASHDSDGNPIFNGPITFTSSVADWTPESVSETQP